MKNILIFISALFIITVLSFSCNKEYTSNPSTGTDYNHAPKVVNGILNFESKNQFLECLFNLSQMSTENRQIWEKEIGFKSMSSYYQEFNKKLLNMFALKDSAGFKDLTEKYKSIIHWMDNNTRYDVNCRSLLEANLVNKDGLVKIGNQLTKMDYEKTTTILDGNFNDLQKYQGINYSMAKGNVIVSLNDNKNSIPYLREEQLTSETCLTGSYVSPPNVGNYYQNILQMVTYGSRYRFYAYTTIHNYNTNEGFNAGLITVRYWGEIKGFIGIWGKASCGGVLNGIMEVKFMTPSNSLIRNIDYSYNSYDPATGATSTGDTKDNEVVVLASNFFKTHTNLFTGDVYKSLPLLADQYFVDDSFLQDTNGYWGSVCMPVGPFLPWTLVGNVGPSLFYPPQVMPPIFLP